MIERNLGNVERVTRLVFGLFFGAWVMTRPDITAMDVFVLVIALTLILNGIFSRCYLWYVLDINTMDEDEEQPTTSC